MQQGIVMICCFLSVFVGVGPALGQLTVVVLQGNDPTIIYENHTDFAFTGFVYTQSATETADLTCDERAHHQIFVLDSSGSTINTISFDHDRGFSLQVPPGGQITALKAGPVCTSNRTGNIVQVELHLSGEYIERINPL